MRTLERLSTRDTAPVLVLSITTTPIRKYLPNTLQIQMPRRIHRGMLGVPSLLLSLLAIVLLPACAPEADPIRIGATMSESGAYSTQGTAARNGYRLCADHLNDNGGLLGRPVEFVIYDDESDSDTAVRLYEQLITEDNVDAIMGPYGSTLTEAVAPVTEEHQMVHVSPLAATSSIWEQGREYLFMVLPPAELFLAGLIDLADERELSRVAVVHEDELFPEAAGQGAVQLAEEAGLEVVVEATYPTGTEDFTDILAEIEAADAEVVAMAASPLDDFIAMVEQMREARVDVQMFGTSGAVDEFQDALGSDAEYAYGLSAWEPSLPYPGVDEFVDAYTDAFDRAPSFHAAGGYGSCQLFAEAVEEAGTLDADPVRDALLALETTTVFGPYAVDERGYQTANEGTFIQWQDGKRVVVWPEDVAVAAPRFPTPPWSDR